MRKKKKKSLKNKTAAQALKIKKFCDLEFSAPASMAARNNSFTIKKKITRSLQKISITMQNQLHIQPQEEEEE